MWHNDYTAGRLLCLIHNITKMAHGLLSICGLQAIKIYLRRDLGILDHYQKQASNGDL